MDSGTGGGVCVILMGWLMGGLNEVKCANFWNLFVPHFVHISFYVHYNSCWQAVLAFISIGIFKYIFSIIVHKNCSLDMI